MSLCTLGMFFCFLSVWGQPGIAIPSMQCLELSSVAGALGFCANAVTPKAPIIASARVPILMFFSSRLSALQNGRIGIVRLPGLFHSSNDFVVFVTRQYTDKRHHSLHKSAPSCAKAIVLRPIDHLVHRHHWPLHVGVLREVWYIIRVFCKFVRR